MIKAESREAVGTVAEATGGDPNAPTVETVHQIKAQPQNRVIYRGVRILVELYISRWKSYHY